MGKWGNGQTDGEAEIWASGLWREWGRGWMRVFSLSIMCLD